MKVLTFINRQKIPILFMIIFAVTAAVSPYFLTLVNLVNLLMQVSIYGVIACGMTFIVLCGEFDISVGSVLALTGVIAVSLINKVGYVPAVLAVLGIGFVTGFINSVLVNKVGISSFVVTMGGMIFYRGLALVISNGDPVTCESESYMDISMGTLWGVPSAVYLFIILFVVTEFILKKTRFGRNIYATGGNFEVAKNAGIRVTFYKTAAFICCSMSAALAGVLLTSRLNTASPLLGEDAALTALSAVVLGGTLLAGGSGGALRTFTGVMILGLIVNALNMLQVYSYYQLAIKGLLLVVFIFSEKFSQNRGIAAWGAK
jgi:ribose/xylose/arabinose/galactoside ABC-type transport system permease subunit